MKIEDIESELAGAFNALIPEGRPALGLAERVESTAKRVRRRRRGRVAAFAVVVLMAGGLGAGLRARNYDSDAPVVAASPPPVIDQSDPHLVVSPAEIPPDTDGEISLIASNPTSTPIDYGLSGTVYRWSGSRWDRFKVFVGSNIGWQTGGELDAFTGNTAVASLGLKTPAHGYGAVLWVPVTGLTPGYYRFGMDGGPAGEMSGVLQIKKSSPTVLPVLPGPGPVLDVVGVVRAGQADDVTVLPTMAADLQSTSDMTSTLGKLTGPITLQRYDGRDWTPLSSRSVGAASESPSAFSVHLPGLLPGLYRISRASTKAGTVRGVFWVLAPVRTQS